MWRRAAFMRQRGLSLSRKQTAPAMKSRNRTHSTAGATAGDAQEIIRAFGTGLGRGEGGRDTNVGTTAGPTGLGAGCELAGRAQLGPIATLGKAIASGAEGATASGADGE